MKPRKLAIYGAGGFGREILPIVRDHMARHSDRSLRDANLVFVDDRIDRQEIAGVPVVSLDELAAGDGFILAIGTGATREILSKRCEERDLIPQSVFHDSFRHGPDTTIGEGAVFCFHSVVTASATIGRYFHCNMFSYVTHDCVVGDFVTFAPNVSCNGNVHIGDHAYIGTGAIIRNGTAEKPLKIGAGAIVGMGAVVARDVPPGATVVGNPARIVSMARLRGVDEQL